MRIVVLDPGLFSRSGHHFHVTLALRDAASEAGIETRIWAHRTCEQPILDQLQARPAFTWTPYGMTHGLAQLECARAHVIGNQSFSEELRALDPQPAAEDVIFVHTITHTQLLGLGLWYADLPEPRPRICILLRFPPWFRAPAADHGLALAFYQQALALWRDLPGARATFVVDNTLLGRLFERICNRPVAEVPIPIRYAPPSPPRPVAAPPHLVFMGEPRIEKGFLVLLEALSARPERFRHVRVTIQADGAGDGTEFIAQCEAAMPFVRFLPQTLAEPDYQALLNGADAVLVPYDPNVYNYRTSHVFIEAVGQGKPVLITKGSWMDLELARFGPAGVRAESYDGAGVADALDLLTDNLAAFRTAAETAAVACRNRHNPEAFLKGILDAVSGL